ncbi:MAG TPA: beta-ketoacyl synthase chain length factor [Rudaea sp.]|nr:beta-ketoacyl synthase chain length factor [Rudaea sp.]
MSDALHVGIEGIGVWSPKFADWNLARNHFRGESVDAAVSSARPAPAILPANERRRAPEAVLLALEVAQQACTAADRNPRELPNVFASAYGDLIINDYMCDMLARAPLEISPTRFHNSVHNAAAGYWAIASGCMQSSSAISAGWETFGAGLLEAALLALDLQTPVLSVACDVAACGALVDVIPSRSAFAVAMVLAPPSARAIAQLRVRTQVVSLASTPAMSQSGANGNPIALSLPLLQGLAQGEPRSVDIAAGPELNLSMEMHFD